jgi:hypothetical protein
MLNVISVSEVTVITASLSFFFDAENSNKIVQKIAIVDKIVLFIFL